MAIDPRQDPRTGERVYQEIKEAILKGDLRLRQRLDIDTLAQRLSASATPVRQALAILAAERLVTVHAARGYYVAFWSERDLKTLYEWRGQLAQLAAQSYAAPPPGQKGNGDPYLGVMRRLENNANTDLKRASLNADERLSAALAAEAEIMTDRDVELDLLKRALERDDRRALQTKLRAYFRRRIESAGAIRVRAGVSALPRNGD